MMNTSQRLLIVMVVVICTLPYSLSSTVQVAGQQTPHVIHGAISDSEGVPVMEATVFLNNTNTTESLMDITDLYGRYSVDLSAYPSGYLPGHNITVTAVYLGYNASKTIEVNTEPNQPVFLTLGVKTYVINGTILKPDLSPARIFSVNIKNNDTSETHFTVTNNSGGYRMDLVGYESGYSVGHGIFVSVDFLGFEGSNVSIVTNGSGQSINVKLSDVQPPSFAQLSAPDNATHDSAIDITVRVVDNYVVENVFIHFWDIHETGNIVEMNEYGPSRYNVTIPQQNDIGIVEFYISATDGINSATLPATFPPMLNISIIDMVPPTITHTALTTIEAGETVNIVAEVTDDLGPASISEVLFNYSEAGSAVFNEIPMSPTGDPDEYNATLPAQTQLGILRYRITASDSDNTASEPVSGTFDVDVEDTTPPDIDHVPINSANVGDVVNITATITDFIGLDSVYLNYTNITGVNDNVSMEPWAPNWSFDIPSQAATGTLSYFIWANDTEGNITMTPVQNVQINDVGTPLIVHAPVETAEVFFPINITATITDNVTVAGATICYMQVGNATYENVSMTFASGEWSAEIPSQGELGVVKYYINATDGFNNITHPALKPCHNISIIDTTPPNLAHGPMTLDIPIVGLPRSIWANVSDNYNISSVFLFYRAVNNQTWESTQMTHVIIDSRGNGSYSGVIPAQQIPGNVTYYFWANDTSGNNSTCPDHQPKLNPFNYTVIDAKRPEIVFSPPSSINVNETLTIFVNATDDQVVTDVDAHYNGTEDEAFTTITLYKSIGDSYTGQIPAQNLSGLLQVYVTATDGVNQNQTIVHNITVVNSPPVIEHNEVTSALIGRAINLLAVVTDDLKVEDVELDWRIKGYADYTTKLMKKALFDIYGTSIGPFDSQVTIEYQIKATDRETSAVWPETGNGEIEIGDTSPPVITHERLTNLTTGSLPIITCDVTDDVGVQYVMVYYTNASSETENSLELSKISNNEDTYVAILGKQPKGEFAYHLEASDGINVIRMPATGEFTVEVTAPPSGPWGTVLLVLLVILMVVAVLLIYQYRRKTNNG